MSRFAFMLVLAVYGLGILWCREMFLRWREDWDTLRDPQIETANKFVAALLWIATGVIVIGILTMTLYLAIQLKTSL